MTLAITGGTGFVGGATIAMALNEGFAVRALTRRPQRDTEGLTWVSGALNRPDSLDTLVEGASAVLHIAGVVNSPDRDGFAEGNVEGTGAVLAAARRAGVARFIHVSSLAAREPDLSDYGWSKAEAEAAVRASSLEWDMVRPPAIYGPGDMEMLELFRLARRGIAFTPPAGRLSVIEVSDLSRLLLALAASPARQNVYEVDDATPGGWEHKDFARAIGTAVGRRVAAFALPRPLLSAGAQLDRLARGARAKLTPDRVAYFCHPDWTIDPLRRPAPDLWQPSVPTPEGLAATAAWYRAQGLL